MIALQIRSVLDKGKHGFSEFSSRVGRGNSHTKSLGKLVGEFELNPPKKTNLSVARGLYLTLRDRRELSLETEIKAFFLILLFLRVHP